MLGKMEGGRRGGPQRMRWLDGITDAMDEWFLEPLVLLAPRSSISLRSLEVEDKSLRAQSPISCQFGEVTVK